MSVDKVFLFVCTRVVSRTCDLQHVGAEGLWGADISEVSKITTSNCMKRTLTRVPQRELGLCLAFVFEAYSAHFRELNSSSTLKNILDVFFDFHRHSESQWEIQCWNVVYLGLVSLSRMTEYVAEESGVMSLTGGGGGWRKTQTWYGFVFMVQVKLLMVKRCVSLSSTLFHLVVT